MKKRVSHMNSSYCGVWFEKKARFGGEFEAARVFPAEDRIIQVSSRRHRVAFCRAEIALCRASLLLVRRTCQANEQKQYFAMICFVFNDLLCFCSVFESTLSNKGSGLDRSFLKSTRKVAGVFPGALPGTVQLTDNVAGILKLTDHCSKPSFMC